MKRQSEPAGQLRQTLLIRHRNTDARGFVTCQIGFSLLPHLSFALSSPPLSSPLLTLPFLRMSFCSKSVTQPPVKSQNEWNRSGEFKIKFVQLIRLALSRSLSTELIELPNCLLALAVKTTRLRNSRLYFFFCPFSWLNWKAKTGYIPFIMCSHRRKEMSVGWHLCNYLRSSVHIKRALIINNLSIQFKPSSSLTLGKRHVVPSQNILYFFLHTYHIDIYT